MESGVWAVLTGGGAMAKWAISLTVMGPGFCAIVCGLGRSKNEHTTMQH